MFFKEVRYENANGELIRRLQGQMDDGFSKVLEKQDHHAKQLNQQTEQMSQQIAELLERFEKNEKFSESSIKEAADDSTWLAWRELRERLLGFDTISAQYILFVDRLSKSDLKYYRIFSECIWNLVVDLDPDSEVKGLMKEANLVSNNIIVTYTPISIKDESQHLDRSVDPKRTHWVFANGRNKDDQDSAPKKDFREWKLKFAALIGKLFDCLVGKLDSMRPVICVILPIREDSKHVTENLLEKLNQSFSSHDYSMSYVVVNCNSLELSQEEFCQLYFATLQPEYICLGIKCLLGYEEEGHLMPTPIKDIDKPLNTETYNYITENLELLYKGCENLPAADEWLDDEDLEDFKKEHMESFIGGNPISFVSLACGHDARREINSEIYGHITKLLSGHLAKAVIVEIVHSPGSGGTTIARRVVWDLHRMYPCAIVNLTSLPLKVELDKDFNLGVTDRIRALEEACETPPVILVDGSSSDIQIFSDQLVRKLRASGIKAVILRCLHRFHVSGKKGKEVDSVANHVFQVNSKLEDSHADLDAFKKKYESFLADLSQLKGSRRVFHFPLLVMMGNFQDFLKGIVVNSMESIRRTSSLEHEIAILVAFIQKYAGRPTPALLIRKVFSRLLSKLLSKLMQARCVKANELTYKGLAGCLSDDLLNLMVRERAPTRKQWASRRNEAIETTVNSPSKERMIECYTFQHVAVADLVLQCAQRTLRSMTEDFLSYPIYDLLSNEGHQFRLIINELFLYNEREQVTGFSLIINELEVHAPDMAKRVLLDVAESTKDALFYCHAAKYFSRRLQDYDCAKQLIKTAFAIDVNASSEKKRKIYDFLGNILLAELRKKKEEIRDFDELEASASKALDAFKEARDFPPSKPYPLLGEVKVWIECYSWIFKQYRGNTEKGLQCIMTKRPFFSTSVGDCFYRLDLADKLLNQEVDLNNVEITRKEINNYRLKLLSIIGWSDGKSSPAQQPNRVQSCEILCSPSHFKTVSPKEMLRLKVAYIFKFSDRDEEFSEAEKRYALKLLERLVLKHGDYSHAQSLLKMARQQNQENYTIDRAFEIVGPWCTNLPYDPQGPFYLYILAFLRILNGDVMEYKTKYEQALRDSLERSTNNLKRYNQQFYLLLETKENKGKISQLITRPELDKRKSKDKQVKGNQMEYDRKDLRVEESAKEDDEFWQRGSRNYLLECSGRIYTKKDKGKEQPYIALTQGRINVHVPRNAVGKAHVDYQVGRLVYFVIGFSLAGPLANGVSFEPFEGKTEN